MRVGSQAGWSPGCPPVNLAKVRLAGELGWAGLRDICSAERWRMSWERKTGRANCREHPAELGNILQRAASMGRIGTMGSPKVADGMLYRGDLKGAVWG